MHVCDHVYICLLFTSLDPSLQEGRGLMSVSFIEFGSRSNAIIHNKFSLNISVELMNGSPNQKKNGWMDE